MHTYSNPTKIKFVVPVGNMTQEEAKIKLEQLIQDYKKDVVFDDNSGEIRLNNTENNSEWWIPVKSNSTDGLMIVDIRNDFYKPNLWQRFVSFFKNLLTKKNK